MQLADFRAAINSAFRHAQHVIGNAFRQIDQRIQTDLEGLKIAAIHADNICAAFKGALEFLFIMDFTQSIQVQSASVIQQPAESSIVQRRHN